MEYFGQRRQLHTASIMHKILINNKIPLYLSEKYKPVCESTAYNLRDSHVNVTLPKPKTEYLERVSHIEGLSYGTRF